MTTCDNQQKIKKQVNALLAAMTLEEKISQLGSYWYYDLQTNGKLDDEKLKSKLKHGIGQITRIAGAGNLKPLEAARAYNRIQKFLKEETRLGIPAINHEECCSGLMSPESSIFPQMIGLASTFQPELAMQMTAQIRKQMLAIGARQGLAPVLDVARDARWGRIEETFGEDPLLVSQFGVAYIKGLQGDDPTHGVMATGKHFVGHAFSQGGLNCGPVHLGARDLWDIYLVPFQAAIRDAGLQSMMNAYPELDGEVVAASKRILTDLLRSTLGFDGLVVSDYEAVMMIHNYHYAAASKKEAAIKALTAGIDVEMPSVTCYGQDLLDALDDGGISLETIDLSVSRHLQKKYELGLFDDPFVDEGNTLTEFETPENRALAYKIACQSMVLLKNDGLLPLSKSIKSLAVIGPNADSGRNMMGDYSFAAVLELMHQDPPPDSGFCELNSDEIEKPSVEMPTVLESIRNAVSTDTSVRYAKGCDINTEDVSGFAEANALAQESDAVVLVMGHRSGLGLSCTTGEFRDSSDLGLPGIQDSLVQSILETGKPVVLVLINGRPASIPTLVEGVNAVLEAWVPGEEGGRAVASALFGDINPGGKIPVSIPRSVGQVPVFYNYKPSGMHSNIYGDYVSESVTPLFAFGHGLSYTEFKYSDLIMNRKQVSINESVDISLKITNTGKAAGDEAVQLYIRDKYASMPRPVKELRGFVRVSLAAGESKRVTFHLPANMMAYYDQDLRLILEPGKIEIMVGSSSVDIHLKSEFEIIGDGIQAVKERVFVCPVDVSQAASTGQDL
jgi:beta-glucosidase